MSARSVIRTTACIAALAASAKYAHLAVVGRVFPFAPVAVLEDPDGPHNTPNYTPTFTIDLYLVPQVNLRTRISAEMEYMKGRSENHFANKRHRKPLRLSMWSTAIKYYTDQVAGGDRRCLVATGKHVDNVYLETIVESHVD